MKFVIKTVAVRTLRNLLKTMRVLPVAKNKILFSAYEGMQFGCNPRYIFEYLFEKIPDLDFVWVLNDPSRLPAKYRGRVRTVKFLSAAHLKELSTSRVIISNLGIEPFLPKRKEQTFINTWHGGGAYKRVSWDMNVFSSEQQKYMTVMRDFRSASTDVFLSSCRCFSQVSSEDFGVDYSKFVATGMPRNDRLVLSDSEESRRLREEICKEYGIDPESLLVLYAPTFRGTFRNQQHLDMQVCSPEVAEAFSRRFVKPVTFLFRSHVAKDGSKQDLTKLGVTIADFTEYPDMQELLQVADVLITDYSSSIWDFSLTGKPAFLFMPDLKEYTKSHGFYTALDKWPYPYAESVEEFNELILGYNPEENKQRIEMHLELLGSYETGDAREKVTTIIKEKLKGT